jgi:CHAT domain-containing protein
MDDAFFPPSLAAEGVLYSAFSKNCALPCSPRRAALGLALLLIGALVVARRFAIPNAHPADDLIADAQRAVADGLAGSVEPRVSLGLAYHRRPPTTTAPGAEGHNWRRDLIAAKLEQRVRATDDPSTANLAAVSDLLQHRYSEAIGHLERALARSPGDARTLTNLSAVLASRSAPGDRVRSLDAATAAIATGHADGAAWFDVALAVERLLPRDAAVKAWQDALAHESSPEWKTEIAGRLARASALPTSPATALNQARVSLDDDILTHWAQACAGRAADERQWAERAAALARTLDGRTEDLYLQDLSSWLGLKGCDSQRASAYVAFAAARRLYLDDRRAAALSALEPLVPRLSELGSPAVVSARVLLATCQYFTAARAAAVTLLDNTRDQARARRYYDVLGRAEWMRGYAAEDGNAFDRARIAYRAAIDAFKAAGDAEGVRAVQSLVASVHDTLGEYAEGWRLREDALSTLRLEDTPPRWLHAILGAATRTARRDGWGGAALRFADARLQAARADDAPIRVAEAATELARVEIDNGFSDRARLTLVEARDAAERIDSDSVRARVRAGLALAEARSSMGTDPAVAFTKLSDALTAYSSTGADLQLGGILLQRARVRLTLGDDTGAERDLLQGIEVFESARRRLGQASVRISYFEEAWQLFDELLALKVRLGEFDRALEVVERGRGRALRDMTQAAVTPKALAAHLPQAAIVLCYAVLDHELVLWSLRAGQIRVVTRPIGSAELQKLVAAAREEVQTDSHQATTRLYDLLIGPVEPLLGPGDRLYIVPDPLLHHLSFAELWRSATRQYLVERHTLVMLPNLGTAQVSTRRAAPTFDRALIVAAPNGGVGDGLPQLPAVDLEAREIQALYPTARLLTAEGARKSTIVAALQQYPVMHFAGHAVVNAESPDLSRLMLSPDADEGRLYARDLERLDLRRLRIVTLAACQTASGRTYRSEGVLSLARSFLTGGVSSVVGTLWDVDDMATGQVFTNIHQRIQEGRAPQEAVADVQRTMIRRGASRATWAAVVVISRTIS